MTGGDRFSATEVKRLIKVALDAGFPVLSMGIEVEGGRIRLLPPAPIPTPMFAGPDAGSLETWRMRNGHG